MSALRDDARPLTAFLANAPEFSRRLKETGEPVLLAVEGGTDVIVQDADSYQKLLDEVEQARALEGIRQGLEDMRAGRTIPLDEAFADIRRELGLPQAP
jgi:PHD/YefM family antitoxin component YafN of YafNO toxin-antitoxin module